MKLPKSLTGWMVAAASLFPMASASSLPVAFFVLHSATPAGYDVVVLQPSNTQISFLGLIECPDLEGAQHVAQGVDSKMLSADGQVITNFPRNFSFRITASLRKTVLSGPSGTVTSPTAPRDLLLQLQFRLKAFDGLKVREIDPESVQMIGVPADVPYDERIYRVTFNVDKLPIRNRLVLEVCSPEGTRLSRFHFDLL